MRFERLRLRNFKPYADAELDLRDGVTVIHGLNGSGKSSLLEACFFALYGARALDDTLEEVVTTGADEAEVTLGFVHDGDAYEITRDLRRSGDRISTTTCTLDGPDVAVDGARDVRAFVTDRLRMDAEAFVNCAYVRQGEVNKLINATPTQRQDIIDDLLQLGKLEEYRDRAGQARLGVEDVLNRKRELLSDRESRIEAKEEAGLHERLNELETELAAVDDDIERFEENRDRAEETLADAEAVLSTYEERTAEIDDLDDDIEELEATIKDDESTREELKTELVETGDQVDELRSQVTVVLDESDLDAAGAADLAADAIEARRDALDADEASIREDLQDARKRRTMLSNQAANLEERADELDSRAEEARHRADEAEASAVDADDRAAEYGDELKQIDNEIESLRERFDDAPVDPGEAATYRESIQADLDDAKQSATEARTELESARNRLEEAEALRAEGKCPECGQPVEGSPHVAAIDDHAERVADLKAETQDADKRREELTDRLATAESLADAASEIEERREKRSLIEDRVADAEEAANDHRTKAASIREDAAEYASEADEKRAAAETQSEAAAGAAEQVASLEADLESVATAADRLDRVADLHAEVEAAESRIDRLRERRTEIAERNDERRAFLAEKRERRRELADAIDESRIETAEANRSEAESYLERVAEKLADLRGRRDEIQTQIGGVNGELSNLEDLREERAEVADRVADLESLHAEVATLETTYTDLRAELRKRNVETLERMLNETFELVYGNDAYARIRLDDEYGLTVFQKDGTALEPGQLSGGERALFNLSLRCAIYRLLAEGIEGAAPMPPLILDEPTVFLDSGHVSRLVDLVEEMRTLGVAQILIVSHDDELVAAADDLVTVEKDPTTNRSSVRRHDDAALIAAELGADD